VYEETAVKSSIVKRSIVIAGRNTSVSLEDEFWKAFKEIAYERNLTLPELAATIDAYRQHANLSSAIRLFVLGQYRDQLGFYREESSDYQGTLRDQLVGTTAAR
jgi:predicted DNA-binding ribbon-helix-helix protein